MFLGWRQHKLARDRWKGLLVTEAERCENTQIWGTVCILDWHPGGTVTGAAIPDDDAGLIELRLKGTPLALARYLSVGARVLCYVTGHEESTRMRLCTRLRRVERELADGRFRAVWDSEA